MRTEILFPTRTPQVSQVPPSIAEAPDSGVGICWQQSKPSLTLKCKGAVVSSVCNNTIYQTWKIFGLTTVYH